MSHSVSRGMAHFFYGISLDLPQNSPAHSSLRHAFSLSTWVHPEPPQ